ncbi:expressed unknown protein [Seminavis robusta]|uniref:Uncharacterized protein n=1 Tax=Seminavis robusta TaxID=568900 RepID=A0A9N8HQE9_9STRA|nr:expressed unknown protein [Seminavis robusta]|eukprot:Sro1187_g250490.1 n/a (342) ;mRNA; f:17642-18794
MKGANGRCGISTNEEETTAAMSTEATMMRACKEDNPSGCTVDTAVPVVDLLTNRKEVDDKKPGAMFATASSSASLSKKGLSRTPEKLADKLNAERGTHQSTHQVDLDTAVVTKKPGAIYATRSSSASLSKKGLSRTPKQLADRHQVDVDTAVDDKKPGAIFATPRSSASLSRKGLSRTPEQLAHKRNAARGKHSPSSSTTTSPTKNSGRNSTIGAVMESHGLGRSTKAQQAKRAMCSGATLQLDRNTTTDSTKHNNNVNNKGNTKGLQRKSPSGVDTQQTTAHDVMTMTTLCDLRKNSRAPAALTTAEEVTGPRDRHHDEENHFEQGIRKRRGSVGELAMP